jgi:hypothetical protein
MRVKQMSKVACLTLTGAVAAGIVFQAGHFVEHAVQMGVFIFGSHTTPYMSPVAMYLTHLLGTYFFPAQQMAYQMAAGMEILHLIGNLIFLATIAGFYQLCPTPNVRTALWIETFHLYEHIMLTSTVVFLGKAVGLSTLFGGAEVLGGHVFAVGFRVSWHFALNLVPTIYVMRALMRDAPAAVKAMKLNFATMAG